MGYRPRRHKLKLVPATAVAVAAAQANLGQMPIHREYRENKLIHVRWRLSPLKIISINVSGNGEWEGEE